MTTFSFDTTMANCTMLRMQNTAKLRVPAMAKYPAIFTVSVDKYQLLVRYYNKHFTGDSQHLSLMGNPWYNNTHRSLPTG